MKKTLRCAAAILLVMTLLFTLGCTGDKPSSVTKESTVPYEPVETTQEVVKPLTKRSNYTQEELDKMIAFTFDDGPNSATTSRVLDALEQYEFTATFFVVGNRIAESNEPSLRRMVDMGCEIGNHTWSHNLKLNSLSADSRASEMNKVNDAVKEATDFAPTIMRPPGGTYSGIKGNLDMPIIIWSVDTNDWRKKGNAGNAEAARDLADYIKNQVEGNPGSIVLMHDIYEFTAETVELVVPELAAEGYIIMSVSDLAAAYGVELKPGQVYFSIDQPLIVEPGEYTVATKNDPLRLRLNTEDDASNTVLAKIPKGTVVVVTESVDGWAKVEYEGQTGWVNAKFLEATGNTPAPAETTTEAETVALPFMF